MRTVISLILALLLTSCGGTPQKAVPVEDHLTAVFADNGNVLAIVDERVPQPIKLDQEEETGTLEQPYTARATASYQFGVTTTSARMQCNRTTSSQSCSVPINVGLSPRTVTYFIDPDSFGPPGSPDNDEIFDVIETIDGQLSGWDFIEVFDTDPWPTFVINDVGCSGGSTSNNIDAFSCVNLTAQGTNLTEGPGIVGQYTTHTYGVGHIDLNDVEARTGSSGIQHLRLVRHAGGHAVISWMGLGSRTDTSANGFLSERAIDLNDVQFGLSSGEVCRANSYSAISEGNTFNLFPTACSGAN